MELSKINSLVELFFTKYKELNSTSNKPFLKWLKDNKKDFLTWKQVERNIQILSEYLRKNLSKGDRCILLSENRPEWLISDIAIMNAGGVTVPLFTTYSEKDYEYIINDCNPKICIVSNNNQLKKIDKFISDNIKVLSIENIDKQNAMLNQSQIEDAIENASYEDGLNFVKKNCATCHSLDDPSKNKIGPSLVGVFGRDSAAIEDYKYSKALSNVNIQWD